MAMTRRQLFRMIAYGLLGILLILLLVVYALYLSAQSPPRFYRDSLEVPLDTQRLRSQELVRKVNRLNNSLQETEKPWEAVFTMDELNAYFAVEVAKDGSNLFPPEVQEPRITFSNRQADFACRLNQGSVSGVLHLSAGMALTEPNTLKLRLKNVRLGKLPISKSSPAKMLAEAFEKKGYTVTQSDEDGDPTLTVVLNLNYDKKRKIRLDELDFQNGSVRIAGETLKEK